MAFSQRGGPEINVTPLIDVLLVLLVIFLIVIPNLVKFEEVSTQQPDAEAGEDVESLTIRVRADLSVVIVDGGYEFPLQPGQPLAAGLREHLSEHDHVVILELDDEMRWEHVVGTVDTIRGVAPMTQVALKVPEQDQAP